jgi:Fe-S cluster assembly protein SufD
VSSFDHLAAAVPADGPSWLGERRKAAFARAEEAGFPHRKLEAWKYTPLKRLGEAPFAAAPEAPASADLEDRLGFGEWACRRVVMVNGRVDVATSPGLADLPAGVTLAPLAQVLAEDPGKLEGLLDQVVGEHGHVFTALNTALAADGLVLHVAADTKVDRPVHLVHDVVPGAEPAACYPRVLVVLERGARATLAESYLGPDGATYLVDAVGEVRLGDSSTLLHVREQREGDAGYHLVTVRAELAAGATWHRTDLSVGAAYARADVQAALVGAEAAVHMDGLNAVAGKQHAESFTEIDHVVPHGVSRELYKAILDDESRVVFRGRVVVRQDAQQTDSEQQNRNILLTSRAEVDTKPEMEIYADDVKAAHGATIGQLDPDQLFFLRARGIREPEARRMLIQAFAREIIDRVEDPALARALARAHGQVEEEIELGEDP